MCEVCQQKLDHQAAYYGGKISTLMDALKTGSEEPFEYSEPFCIGGLGSAVGIQYKCRAPFQGDCEYMVDFASAGSSTAQILVSSSPRQSGVDFTGTIIPGFQDSQMDALVLQSLANTLTPVESNWYQVRSSENTIYVLVICPVNAAFVNIQFRQKRK